LKPVIKPAPVARATEMPRSRRSKQAKSLRELQLSWLRSAVWAITTLRLNHRI